MPEIAKTYFSKLKDLKGLLKEKKNFQAAVIFAVIIIILDFNFLLSAQFKALGNLGRRQKGISSSLKSAKRDIGLKGQFLKRLESLKNQDAAASLALTEENMP